jgi:hypothetical protein
MPDSQLGVLVAGWLADERKADHAKGIVHGITSSGGYCPECVLLCVGCRSAMTRRARTPMPDRLQVQEGRLGA